MLKTVWGYTAGIYSPMSLPNSVVFADTGRLLFFHPVHIFIVGTLFRLPSLNLWRSLRRLRCLRAPVGVTANASGICVNDSAAHLQQRFPRRMKIFPGKRSKLASPSAVQPGYAAFGKHKCGCRHVESTRLRPGFGPFTCGR